MEEMIEEILDQRLKDKAVYIRHTDSTRPDKLVSSTLSASVFNFHAEQEKSSHLPIEIWQKKL